MGCLHSKTGAVNDKAVLDANGTKDSNKGTCEFSNIAQAHFDDIGLSQKQVFSLKQSWKGIKRRMEDTGVEMFVR